MAIGFILIGAVYLDQLKRRARDRADRIQPLAHLVHPPPPDQTRIARCTRIEHKPPVAVTTRHRASPPRSCSRPAAARARAPSRPAAGSGSGAGSRKVGKIVYIPGLTGNPFYNTVSCGASTKAKELGVGYSYQGASTFDVAEQTKIVNAVVATKPGAIMISITDPNAMIAPLTAAKRAGIKIIGIDGDLNDKSVMTTNIQADGEKGGELAGDALAKAVGEKGTGAGHRQRHRFGRVEGPHRRLHRQAIAKYPNMKCIGDPVLGQRRLQGGVHRLDHGQHQLRLVGVFGAETNNTQGALDRRARVGQDWDGEGRRLRHLGPDRGRAQGRFADRNRGPVPAR